MGLYEYDESIFDGLKAALPVPSKIPDDDVYLPGVALDTDALITELVSELSEFEFIYPNIYVAKKIITAWSNVNAGRWQSLYNTLFFKYNPIWNKDGTISRTETETRNLNSTDTGTVTNNGNGTETRDLTEEETPNTTETRTGQVAGYNTETFVNSEKNTAEFKGTIKKTNGGSINNSATATTENNLTKTDTGTITRTYTDRETGNIGVTETQKMIEDQRNIVEFNLYSVIINDFKSRFCILVY